MLVTHDPKRKFRLSQSEPSGFNLALILRVVGSNCFGAAVLAAPSAVIFNFVRPVSLGNRVNRRSFIAGLGVAVAWPVVAPAQQFAIPTIGFLHARSREDTEYMVAAFKKALVESGFEEGRTLKIEWRFADG